MRKSITILCFALLMAIVLLSGCTNSGSPAKVAPTPQITSVSQITSSSSCAAFVEGKYTTAVVQGGQTYATLETTGNGKAVLIVSDPTGKDTYTISYFLRRSDKPCEGLYGWRGFTDKNHPASGNFAVVRQNPDTIWMYNDAAGNYDKFELVRV